MRTICEIAVRNSGSDEVHDSADQMTSETSEQIGQFLPFVECSCDWDEMLGILKSSLTWDCCGMH